MKNIMKRAWEIAREASLGFGGSSRDYICLSLKQAWKESKANCATTISYSEFLKKANDLVLNQILSDSDKEEDMINVGNVSLNMINANIEYSEFDENFLDKAKKMVKDFSEQEYKLIDISVIKEVWTNLKERGKNPRGHFDKAGRFWSSESSIIGQSKPSAKYKYSQMNKARTLGFIKDLADKYKCKTKEELEMFAYSD